MGKGRPPIHTQAQLNDFAYTYFKTNGELPGVEWLRKTYSCAFERASEAIASAQKRASEDIDARQFHALAAYAGFKTVEGALKYLKELSESTDVEHMSRRELRAYTLLVCPQAYRKFASAETLRALLVNQRSVQND